MQELAGLVSIEGAAHIIANEFQVDLTESIDKPKIKDIYAGMKNLEIDGKVTRIFNVNEFTTKDGREGKVGSFFLADDTGIKRITCWGTMADKIKDIKEDDTIKIKNGYSRENNNFVEIHLNDSASIDINPEGVNIENIKTSSVPNKARKQIKDVNAGEENIEILGTVVQTYDPNFWHICPTCNKKLQNNEDQFTCNQHGLISNPEQRYVMNCFLDDGTDTIRTVFFSNQIQNLINKNHDEIIEIKNSGNFEDIKNDLLGKIIGVTGRIVENEMFLRKELIAQFVNNNPDPKEELENLGSDKTESSKPLAEDKNSKPQTEKIKTETSKIEDSKTKSETSKTKDSQAEKSSKDDSDDELLDLEDLEEIDEDDVFS